MAEKQREHIRFTGYVQGVGFRYRLSHLAQHYGVTGWVRNEYDGSVSAELQGLPEEIDQIIQQLKQDRYIDITGMDRQNIPPDEQENGFHIRYYRSEKGWRNEKEYDGILDMFTAWNPECDLCGNGSCDRFRHRFFPYMDWYRDRGVSVWNFRVHGSVEKGAASDKNLCRNDCLYRTACVLYRRGLCDQPDARGWTRGA